uniref:Uncharacterized protein n=1 Tax=Romanomermis culicivorax TaxID=13658 RepID=A0A915K5F6_ROMCU
MEHSSSSDMPVASFTRKTDQKINKRRLHQPVDCGSTLEQKYNNLKCRKLEIKIDETALSLEFANCNEKKLMKMLNHDHYQDFLSQQRIQQISN